jgi:hypothetical protein
VADLRPTKDLWDKLQALGGFLGAVAIPIVVLFLGNWLAESIRQGDARAKLVEVAVSILQADPKNSDNVPGLREWAIQVINEDSGRPLPTQSAKHLLQAPLPNFSGAGCCVSCNGQTICAKEVNTPCGSCKINL